MPVDIDITYVAKLARLQLDSEQTALYQRQLTEILEHASRIGQVETGNVEPTGHRLGFTNAFREDEVHTPFPREDLLAAAPKHEDGYIIVPPALESD